MPRFFQPGALLSDESTLVEHPVLEVEAGCLKGIHPAGDIAKHKIKSFPKEVWTRPPALLHAHGESFCAPSHEFRRHSFADWAQDLLNWRAGEEVAASYRGTMQTLRQAGNGPVVFHVNPDSIADALPELASSLAFPFWEFFSPDETQAEVGFAQWRAAIPNPVGVALHAPFSVSLPLAKKVADFAAKAGIPLSIHLGEHHEERQFLKSTSGPLADLMTSRGRKLPNHAWASPVEWLLEILPTSPGPVWVIHGGDLTVEELQILKIKQVRLIWCPGTHRYFERPKPKFFQAGMPPPSLGCDSMASNTELSPLAEFRHACAMIPEYSPQQWWGALTTQAEECLAEAGLTASPFHPGPVGKPAHFLRLAMDSRTSAAALCSALAMDPHLKPLGAVNFLTEEFLSSCS